MTHPLLTDEYDAPGEWETGWISGDYISYSRSASDSPNHEKHVVISINGESGADIESRPIEVWTVTIPEGYIVRNQKQSGETIDTAIGLSKGAEIALEYMEADK